MILSAAGSHFNQQTSSITVEGPEAGAQGVSVNTRVRAFRIGRLIMIPLTIQKGATAGEWTIKITTLLSNPLQEEQVKATFTIR